MPPLNLCDEAIVLDNGPDFPFVVPFGDTRAFANGVYELWGVLDNARVEPEKIFDVHGDGETVLMLLRATRHGQIHRDRDRR